jgi:RNA polymerase sigma-70 factor (ECF subfamily)
MTTSGAPTPLPEAAHTGAAAAHAARAARESYGRLLALLASRSGDLAGAEDALADAFRMALETWPERGIPGNPEAWLLTCARNRQTDVWRSAAARTSVPLDLDEIDTVLVSDIDPDAIPDDRMKLLFVCAHPAVDAALRAPLMLQSVLGVDADAIGRAFLVPATAMAQRLVRVKRKIKDAVIPFALPGRSDMAERLDAVLEAIYGAFAIGWDMAAENACAEGDDDLADEARFLADLLARLLPDEPEVLGLAACISLASSRRAARVSAEGDYVPLDAQDCARWDARQISWGEQLLHRARQSGVVGRFQLEAAIQSVHIDRSRTGFTDWGSLALLYEGLMRLAPAIGAAVGLAIAVGHSQGPMQGLAALDQIEAGVRVSFQPAWAARAQLLTMAGLHADAIEALDQAIALATGRRVVADLTRRRAALVTLLKQRCGDSSECDKSSAPVAPQ